MKKEDIKFILTSHACPEQYEAYDKNGKEIAYLRLRSGVFRVDCPFGGETVYIKFFDDEWKGIFYDEEEREFYLNIAKEKICEYYNKGE